MAATTSIISLLLRRRAAAWALVAVVLAVASPCLAHDPGLSALTLQLRPGEVAVHLALARREVERIVTIDFDGDGTVSPGELEAARPRLTALAARALDIEPPVAGPVGGTVAIEVDESDAVHLRFTLPAPARAPVSVRVALIDRLVWGHRQYVQVRDDGGRLLAEQIVNADRPAIAIPDADSPRGRRVLDLFWLGVEHIATGWDHLLFLLALLVVGPGLPSAARIITSFTAAHSITLTLATFDVVRLSPAVVEPLIALSVLYVGAENLLRAGRLTRRWMLTFGFGLVHGLGFATALRDLGVGATGESVVAPLLAFNLGVESGQLAVAVLVLPLIWRAQREPRLFARIATAASVLVALAGAGWLVQRLSIGWGA